MAHFSTYVILHSFFLTKKGDIWVSEEQRIQFLRLLLSLLPEINRLTLKHLMPIFATVCSQDPERQKSLSYFWGPLLLLRRGTHEYDLQVAESAGLFSILVSNLTEIKVRFFKFFSLSLKFANFSLGSANASSTS